MMGVPNAAAYAVPQPQPYVGMITNQRPPDTAVLVIAWVVAILSLGYMLPWAIAATRGKANQGEIGLLNFFLGWTLIGWVVTLVMACQAHRLIAPTGMATAVVVTHGAPFAVAPPYQSVPVPGWYPAPDGRGRQYWDGYAWTAHRAP